MACQISFDNVPVTGIVDGTFSTTGLWDLIGYSNVAAGPFGAGGNWPWSQDVWGAIVDSSPILPGFYQFKYHSQLPPGDPCYGELIIVIEVVQGTTDIPADVVIDLCVGDGVRNIFNDSGLYALAGTNPVVASIGGAGTGSPGYAAGDVNIVTDDTYDPSAEGSPPVTRVFEITYTPTDSDGGYPLNACDNCAVETVTVTYNVTAAFNIGTYAEQSVCNDGDL